MFFTERNNALCVVSVRAVLSMTGRSPIRPKIAEPVALRYASAGRLQPEPIRDLGKPMRWNTTVAARCAAVGYGFGPIIFFVLGTTRKDIPTRQERARPSILMAFVNQILVFSGHRVIALANLVNVGRWLRLIVERSLTEPLPKRARCIAWPAPARRTLRPSSPSRAPGQPTHRVYSQSLCMPSFYHAAGNANTALPHLIPGDIYTNTDSVIATPRASFCLH